MKKLATFLLLAVIAVPSIAGAQQGTIRINYVNAELGDVIRSLAAVMGVNVVLADVPSRRITFQTAEPVPASQAGAVLEGILEAQGMVLVQTGPVAQVMPEDKRPSTGPIHTGKDLPTPPPLGLVTQIVPLDYVRADEIVQLLSKVQSKIARVEVVPRSNAVLVTDRGVNVARYLDLIRPVDVKTAGEAGLSTYVYALKHANAVELATTLGQVFGATVAQVAPRQRVQALEGKGLSGALGNMQQRQNQSFNQRLASDAGATTAPTVEVAAPADSSSRGGGSRSGLVGGTMIVPDQATNALVIRTAPPNFAVLQETIDRLDVRPPQVLLEVLIAEINLDRNTSTGINWQLYSHAGLQGDSTRGVLGGFGSQNFTGDSGLTSLGGLGIRVVSLATLNVRALLQAVAAHTSFRVLSAPRVLALNNEQARILVGSEVPFTSATISGITSSVDQVVDYRDVGTQLTVLPQINADGYVTLRLLQEVSELSSTTLAAAQNAPIITTREAETSAIVKSGRTVVIGGLISSSRNLTETGIPILKDIPLIGGLFKDRTLDRAKSELAIFLTPYVVFSDEQADSVLQQERKKMPDLKEPLDSILAPKPQ
ncbi:MAG TPA: secretin N-terminal domain-containing protein [Gemmatimonadaceae bacterium]|nr:secretin N-terminal domain-containing protein [Gemmatimonadaceae bacterium]